MKITVYCGANPGRKEVYQEKAIALSKWMKEEGHSLIYGGGNLGLMGALSNQALEEGVEVLGIMPRFLVEKEIANLNLAKLKIVENMSVRKKGMIDEGEAFIALPGGPGTLEEITEVFSWVKLNQKQAPCILYNIEGFYTPLKEMYDTMEKEGFLLPEERKRLFFVESIEEIREIISKEESKEDEDESRICNYSQ